MNPRRQVSQLFAPCTLLCRVIACLTVAMVPALGVEFTDKNWFSMGDLPGTDSEVKAIATDAAGNTYIGGNFRVVKDIMAARVARWDGTNWHQMGAGLVGGVNALVCGTTDVYVGGNFTSAGGQIAANAARWDGTNWWPLGNGPGGTVSALAIFGGKVYAAGTFGASSTNPTSFLACWDGIQWSAVSGGLSGAVYSLQVMGSNLYACGDFLSAGGALAFHVAKFDGVAWSSLGGGLDGTASVMCASETNLFVGGYFTTATNSGGSPVSAMALAKWNGLQWQSAGFSADTAVGALAMWQGNLYVYGPLSTVIVMHDGASWRDVAQVSGWVNVFGASAGKLLAGGSFSRLAGKAALNIGLWDGAIWSTIGTGLDTTVTTSVTIGTNLYAGGGFSGLRNPVVRWNGASWEHLGSGLNDSVCALIQAGTNLYAGGAFHNPDGLARWDGANWIGLGTGVKGIVYALAADADTNLFAGGSFTNAGGVNANYVARWDGVQWQGLSLGLNGQVNALVLCNGQLYAGGSFTSAEGNAASYVARWDGISWHPLGSGLNARVLGLACSGTNIYAAGYFNTAGGISANKIAQWDGTHWSSLGSGLTAGSKLFGTYATAVTAVGSEILVCGNFSVAGGISATNVARWDGTTWSGLGSGTQIGWDPLCLTALGPYLFIGGEFSAAGQKVTSHSAGAVAFSGDWLKLTRLGSNSNMISYVGVPNTPHVIEVATNVQSASWTIVATNMSSITGSGKVIDSSSSSGLGFYRVGRVLSEGF